MATLNKISCVVGGANTGVGDCFLTIAHVVGAIIVPSTFSLSKANLGDLQNALQDAAFDDIPRRRIFPIHNIEALSADNSEDKTVETMGYGGKAPLTEGDYDWTFQYIQGGHCLHSNLRKFNGAGRAVLFYDAKGVLYGRKIGDTLSGIPMVFFFANKFTLSSGSASTAYTIQFVTKPKYMNDELGFVEPDFSLDTILGIQDVALSSHATSTVPIPVITAVAGCDKSDLFDIYETELEDVTAWIATIGGLPVAITSVIADPDLNAWDITLDTADANYSAAGPVVIKMATPLALQALDVVGFESNSVTITV